MARGSVEGDGGWQGRWRGDVKIGDWADGVLEEKLFDFGRVSDRLRGFGRRSWRPEYAGGVDINKYRECCPMLNINAGRHILCHSDS